MLNAAMIHRPSTPLSALRRGKAATVFALLVALACASVTRAEVDFNKDVRPLLSENCLKCHGGVKEAGKLNLQFRDEALKAGSSGEPAIVPGKPDQSEFIARLTTADEDDRMPQKADPLKPEQIALLKQWIAEGAKWENHWAYETPQASGGTIDQMVEARLKKEDLQLAPAADRRTLARRSALDITGVPPSPEEVEAFVNDTAPGAYARWVDRLLASATYGERWATVWLDLARYADSKGYEKDGSREMWRYRDWVVDALNSDKPYDEFITEQLAGDLLPEPTEDQIIATAFHRNTMTNDEGGTDNEEFRTYAVLDRLNTTFDAIQGTTMSCVQCHGHPYDPFVHREYYQLMAFFNNTADADRDDESPTRRFYKPADTQNARALETQLASARQELETHLAKPENKSSFAQWTEEFRPLKETTLLRPATISASAGKFTQLEEGKVRLEGAPPNQTVITIEAAVPAGRWDSIQLEAIPDRALPTSGPGGSDEGNFILSHFRVETLTNDVPTKIDLARAHATYEQAGWPVAESLKDSGDPKRHTGWAVAGATGRSHTATFSFAKQLENAQPLKVRITLSCVNELWPRHVLGSFRLSAARTMESPKFASLKPEIRELLEREPKTLNDAQRSKLQRAFYKDNNPEMAARYDSVDQKQNALSAFASCNLPIMQELTGDKARVTKIFDRGNWLDQRDPVEPATPKILNAWREEYPKNRLGLAKWLTNGENPLTARVHVNRIWEQLFGIGLVETAEDFGSQGDKPIYQNLLDELAVRFQSGMKWSQKELLREIVSSAVYQQSSKTSPELLERDPANRLLARGPRFRLSAEQLRDQALAAAGLLSRKPAGPPVMPYQPPGIWVVPYDGADWKTSPGEDSNRRALYTFVRRAAAYPSFSSFDAPSREFCTVRRTRTNTPLQSLDLLNNPVFFEAARALGKRMEAEGGAELETRLARGVELATLRPARPQEISILRKLHERVEGDLTLVANAILNFDEVLNKN